MKKFLLVLLSIITIVIGVGCKENPVKENEPIFPNEETDHVYATVKYGDITYNITKEDMYINLKKDVGLSMLLEWTDEQILSTIGKLGLVEVLTNGTYEGIDEESYLELVTKEEIKERIESEKYPDGKTSYNDSELKELEQDFSEKFYNFGYRTEEDIERYYQIQLAKEKLAKDYQDMIHSGEKDNSEFGDGDYQTYWKNNYFNQYYMILVPFDSKNACVDTFGEINITVSEDEKGNTQFLNKTTNATLTINEVIEAYIRLFNNSNLFKDSVEKSHQLTEGNEYSIVDGKYQFNLDKCEYLYYSSENVKLLNSDLRDKIDALVPYNSENSDNNCYIAKTNGISDKYYTVLLISKNEKVAYEDAKSEIKKVLLEEELTDEYVENVMIVLRHKKATDLTIYDISLKENYNAAYNPGEDFYNRITKDGELIAEFMGKALYEEEFFNMMDKRYGAFIVSELINYYNVLYDKEINTVYDFTKVGPEADRVLNKSKWKYILEEAAEEKDYFVSGNYTMYGYPTSFGWENFLEDIYSVRTEKELAFKYLKNEIWTDYLDEYYSLKNKSESSNYWKKFNQLMQKLAEEYFSVIGMQIGLTYLDENGEYTSSSDWTIEQTKLVEEFYGLIVDYINDNLQTYSDSIELLKLEYESAPFLIGENNSGKTFKGMDLAKYKTAGIVLVVEEQKVYNNENTQETLANVVKTFWNSEAEDDGVKVYGKTENGYTYIKLSTGYNIYINISKTSVATYEDRLIPTLEEIKLYISDEETDELTDEQKSMVKNYYVEIYQNMRYGYNPAILLFERQGNCEVKLETDNYVYSDYEKFLSITIKQCNKKILYEIK